MKNPVLGAIAVFFFSLSLSVFIFCWQLKVLTRPTFLTNAIESSQIYDNFSQFAAQLKVDESANLNLVAMIKVIAQVTDKETARNTLDPIIISFTKYLSAQTNQLNATLDLKDFKTKLVAKWPLIAPDIYAQEYKNLPLCGPSIEVNQISIQTGDITCQIPTLSSEDLKLLVKNADMALLFQSIPDQIDLASNFKNNVTIDKIRQTFTIINILYPVSLIIVILSLICIILVYYPDVKKIAKTIGWPLFIINIPIVILNLLAIRSVNIWQNFTSNSLSSQTNTVLMPFLEAISRNIFVSIVKLPLVLCAGGVLLLILAIIIPRQEPRVIPPGFDK